MIVDILSEIMETVAVLEGDGQTNNVLGVSFQLGRIVGRAILLRSFCSGTWIDSSPIRLGLASRNCKPISSSRIRLMSGSDGLLDGATAV